MKLVRLSFSCLILCSLFVLSGCESNETNSSETSHVQVSYLEITGEHNDPQMAAAVSKAHSLLISHTFALKKTDSRIKEGPGIAYLPKPFEMSGADTSKYEQFPSGPEKPIWTQVFNPVSKFESSTSDPSKISISIRPPLHDSIPNINIHFYNHRGHKDWQSSINPGNFRFPRSHYPTDSALAMAITDMIVLLTYK